MKASIRSAAAGEALQLHIEGISPADSQDGFSDRGESEPTPAELLAASLASCTATTMELYARRKGWEVGEIQVEVDYAPAQRGSPTRCTIVVGLPEGLPPERRERLMQVGTTSGVHRTLEGEIVFDERIELMSTPAAPLAPAKKRIALLNGLRGALRAPRT